MGFFIAREFDDWLILRIKTQNSLLELTDSESLLFAECKQVFSISWYHLKQCQIMQSTIQWELSFLSRCPDLHLCRTGHTVFAQDALVIALSLKHTGKLKTKWPMAQTDRRIVIL